MFVNYQHFNLCSFVFIITFLSSTALFCSNLTSIDDKDTPCFLEPATRNPVLLRTSSNSLVLPCHVARSKHATVEWWYTDPQELVNIKIYPVYPPVRPTVLRFVTSLTTYSNETDVLDASILLRYVTVDDTGIYRCVIRPWTTSPLEQMDNILFADDSTASTLNYDIQLTGPRLCQSSPGVLPCFTAMRTTSPTVVDAYQTAFLQCVVKSHKQPFNVFWVVGNASVNSVLITDHLTTNQYNGDRLRRVFPLSPVDYSIELSVDRNIHERVYSCVIDGATDIETTLFTYIIRTIDIEELGHKLLNATRHNEKNVEHNILHREQILSLKEKTHVEHDEENHSKEELSESDREDETEEISTAV